MENYDVLIVGAGVAGLNCALHLNENKNILVICKGLPEESDSYLAQGGICRLQGEEDYDSYFEDTMTAGHFENDPSAVECMIRSSPETIDYLISLGVDFRRNADGTLAATREGGHSRNRIHFHDDCTGKEITTRLMQEALKRRNIKIAPHTTLLDIIESGGICCGAVLLNGGNVRVVSCGNVVLACGGIGGIYDKSTNFSCLTGDGVAICINHGVEIRDINYVQIHPTTLYTERKGRSFLISESVRGEGAKLLDKNLKPFTDELKPRDIVTAAIYAQMKKDNTPHVWLDMRPICEEELRSHFPSIVERCLQEGIDVFKELVPVVPAQHYYMGGVKSDLDGKTSMPNLYAVGETCCNGVHGANRLASNSLLESLVFSARAAEDINKSKTEIIGINIELGKYKNPEHILDGYKKTLKAAIRVADGRKA